MAGRKQARVGTGCYELTAFQRVVEILVEDGRSAVLFVPSGWAGRQLPLLSPDALRLVDVWARPDRDFPSGCFVVETGSARFPWGSRSHTTKAVT